MVPHPLQVGQQIRPDKSGIDSAIPLLQPQDMVRTQLLLQVVDDLLQRLHLHRRAEISRHESIIGQSGDFPHGAGNDGKFLLRCLGKDNAFSLHLLCRFQYIDAVIGDPLKIPDEFEKCGSCPAVLLTDLPGAQFNQIAADDIFVMVCPLLIIKHRFSALIGVVFHRRQALLQRLQCIACHIGQQRPAALQRQGRRRQQALVQLRFLFRGFPVRHQPAYHFFQKSAQRQHHYGTQHVKYRMCHGNAEHRCGLLQQQRRQCSPDKVK